MADEKTNDKAKTPGANKAQAIKDAASAASGTTPAHVTPPVNPTEGSKVTRDEAEGEEQVPPRTMAPLPTKKNGADTPPRSAFTAAPAVKTKQQTEAEGMERFATGFRFDMVQLTELYANMRDGNYWSAFRLVVSILNENINPAPLVRGRNASPIAARVQTPVKVAEVDEICQKLCELCDGLEHDQRTHTHLTGDKTGVRASREPNINAVDPLAVLQLIKVVVDLVRQWRQSRN